MKMLLAGIAFAIGLAFASQASALPYCADSGLHGQNACAVLDE
jgi:hypothetical protein